MCEYFCIIFRSFVQQITAHESVVSCCFWRTLYVTVFITSMYSHIFMFTVMFLTFYDMLEAQQFATIILINKLINYDAYTIHTHTPYTLSYHYLRLAYPCTSWGCQRRESQTDKDTHSCLQCWHSRGYNHRGPMTNTRQRLNSVRTTIASIVYIVLM